MALTSVTVTPPSVPRCGTKQEAAEDECRASIRQAAGQRADVRRDVGGSEAGLGFGSVELGTVGAQSGTEDVEQASVAELQDTRLRPSLRLVSGTPARRITPRSPLSPGRPIDQHRSVLVVAHERAGLHLAHPWRPDLRRGQGQRSIRRRPSRIPAIRCRMAPNCDARIMPSSSPGSPSLSPSGISGPPPSTPSCAEWLVNREPFHLRTATGRTSGWRPAAAR